MTLPAAQSRIDKVWKLVGKVPDTPLAAIGVLRWAVIGAMVLYGTKADEADAATHVQEPGHLSAPEAEASQEDLSRAIEQQEFMPAPTFAGGKEGYAFRTGSYGTGYYKDAATPGPQLYGGASAPSARPAPTHQTRFAVSERDALRAIQSFRRAYGSAQPVAVVAGQANCVATNDAADAVRAHGPRTAILTLLVSARCGAAQHLCPSGTVPWVRLYPAQQEHAGGAPPRTLREELLQARKSIAPHRRFESTLQKAMQRTGCAVIAK